MRKHAYLFLSLVFLFSGAFAQEQAKEKQKGHSDQNKFRQMKDLLATPNETRTASGAPGHAYTQQQVDYIMNIRLDENKNQLFGDEKITYHNNSNDYLEYLWIQLDQNMRAKDSKTPDIETEVFNVPFNDSGAFTKANLKERFDGGFNIDYVKNENGSDLSHTINQTMMRINLSKPLAPSEVFKFSIKWHYNINDINTDGGRSGLETFPDGNNNYTIAQFHPRLCVYDNVEGWQNMQFWGRSEFALEFGNFDVKITVPADHILESTGELQNPKDVLTKEQQKRFALAKKSFTDPVFIVSEEEAIVAESKRSTKNKTWHFKANRVRDFAFASSRKYIWDAMAVNINGRSVMAISLYPKEGNPLWEEHSTRVVANSLEEYSKLTFDYPYSKAVSVHSERQGMEYPMICFNYGRPKPDGTYSERVKRGMIGVITHEVGHNFFPMIVNSDERQWTWMDEGLNSFVETLAELDYDPNFITGNLPKDIVPYMGGDQNYISPIMSQGDYVFQFGPNAYTKPAAALYMLRQTIMGPELFDYAFRTYSQRWMFKHPTPADFFRTMEDASAMDLDWFWRGWFYTTDYTDIGIKDVKQYYLSNQPSEIAAETAKKYNINLAEYKDRLVYYVEAEAGKMPKDSKSISDFKFLTDYIESLPQEEKVKLKEAPKYFYEVTFEKPGGLVMPIILEMTYEDGTTERKTYPAQIWRYNENEVKKVFKTNKTITSFMVDPDLETADVDTSNNSWPKMNEANNFDKFKEKVKS
ncbi:MAG: M1 family metallopeptidase [Algibacter sp.]|uniref:M1 family metallopeptidase n=1 Tax=Algibacter sp. TaxID=1872428 RepID=UPI00262E5584|nr:M1 family metallopeptidase [Algibacter sp.]MDG1730008.1 M1 family metallopeptidase [Algibacter sp.]MDG2177250.1 M1 family metallopeptidase [Algibacter sp.]